MGEGGPLSRWMRSDGALRKILVVCVNCSNLKLIYKGISFILYNGEALRLRIVTLSEVETSK